MLRDYLYTKNWSLVLAAFADFTELPNNLQLIGFADITPDSFVWKLYHPDANRFYYLYAEDYVPSLEHVKEEIRQFAPTNAILDLLPAKEPRAFEDSHPNIGTAMYKPPDREYDFIRYANQSGYDFVFLAISDEKLPQD